MHQWVAHLPGPHTTIISLLGHKPDGTSEFSFYTFGQAGTPVGNKPSWQSWLDRHHQGVEVIERPTTDFKPIPTIVMEQIAADVERLLSQGRTVVLVDSGGQTRTGAVCKYLGLSEDTRS